MVDTPGQCSCIVCVLYIYIYIFLTCQLEILSNRDLFSSQQSPVAPPLELEKKRRIFVMNKTWSRLVVPFFPWLWRALAFGQTTVYDH